MMIVSLLACFRDVLEIGADERFDRRIEPVSLLFHSACDSFEICFFISIIRFKFLNSDVQLNIQRR